MAHKIVYKRLDELQAAEQNPKKHELDAILRSISRFGFVAPAIVDDATGRLVAGHGRVEALRMMQEKGSEAPSGIQVKGKAWLVPVVSGLTFSEQEAAAYLLADNRLSEVGGWDFADLHKMLGTLSLDGFNIADVGYTAADLKAIEVEALVGHIPQYTDKDAPKAPAEPGQLVDEGPADAPKGPSDALSKEVDAQIRRVMLYLTTEQYNRAVDLLSRAMAKTGAKNHSEVVIALLEQTYGSEA